MMLEMFRLVLVRLTEYHLFSIVQSEKLEWDVYASSAS